jgi:hypothetical protein
MSQFSNQVLGRPWERPRLPIETTDKKELLRFIDKQAPGGLRGSAYHESSHGVVSELLNFPVDYISIVPNVKRRVVSDVGIGINIGSCQLIVDKDGLVHLDYPFRNFCYHTQQLASIPTEKRLGILTEESVSGDLGKLFDSLEGSDEQKRHFGNMILVAAHMIVNHSKVWAAITEVAETVLEQHRITGDTLRQIMKKHVPAELYVTNDEAMAINKDLEERGGPALQKWASRFLETDYAEAAA